MGLRVLVGRRQAVVSTNDIEGDVRRTRRARGRDGARRARGRVCRPCRSGAAGAQRFPISIWSIPSCRRSTQLERARQAPKRPGLAVKGVSQVGRRLGLRRHRRHGAGDQPRLFAAPISARATACRCRRSRAKAPRWRRDYDYSSALHAADLDAAGEDRAQRRRARGGAAQSAQGLDPQGAGGVRSARRRLAGRPSRRRRSTAAAIARKTSFLKDKLGERLFAPGIRIVDDPLRQRGLRSRPFDAEGVAGRAAGAGRGRRAEDLAARLRDRARA